MNLFYAQLERIREKQLRLEEKRQYVVGKILRLQKEFPDPEPNPDLPSSS